MDLARPLTVISPTVDADVLAVLARARAAFTGRQVHQLAGRHSERGVRNALHRLCEQGIVTRERIGPSDWYALNRAHLAAPPIVALAQLRTELLHRVTAELEAWVIAPEYAALFGSAARGDMRPDSDIDLFVVRPGDVDPDDDSWREQLAGLAHDVTAWTGNDTRVLEMSAPEVRAGLASGKQVLLDIREVGHTLHGPNAFLRSDVRPRSKGRRRG